MEYDFRRIEKEWQKKWQDSKVYEVSNESDKPKCYVLDMFPYPSGAGLHVGHPLGYIASDIYARYKRLKGFNVLHPMGYDSFGLPAEQYALETGQHPAVTTEKNINTFRSQLDNIGFCFDWNREVRTSDPKYYKWTQWIFLQIFDSWYDKKQNKARRIEELIKIFEQEGSKIINDQRSTDNFSSQEWSSYNEAKKMEILMSYRLAYSAFGEVNWCEALGTVLANDEVINGVSERGGHPVVKRKMRQWYLRITDYAERLLQGLEKIDFSDAMKEMQRNWIGKSEGAEIQFKMKNEKLKIEVYTTRPDTIFGVDFMVLAPEHELVNQITTPDQKVEIDKYLEYVKSRSERERLAEVKQITGAFTGAYAINPFDGREIPVWISEYVLAGYGTGAIMAVPCGDQRDFNFAKHFYIPITNIIGEHYNGEEANPTKDAILTNSGFLNGMVMKDAIPVVLQKIEEMGIGIRKVNYKMRDAGFSRQRYWGEPFPIVYKDGVAYAVDEKELPVELPHVESYKPGPEGQGPLANIQEWVQYSSPNGGGWEGARETNTMPGYAGSSWYFLRYMDPHNDKVFADKKATDYWNQVDVYVGGTEHAVGHLLYSRLWTKILFDLGYISFDEPYKKLVNQGMIQGVSEFIKELIIDKDFIDVYKNFEREVTFINNGQIVKIRVPFGSNHNHIYLSLDADFDFELNVIEKTSNELIKVKSYINEHRAKIQFINQSSDKSVLNIEDWMTEEKIYNGSVLIGKEGYWQNFQYFNFNNELTSKRIEILTRPVVEKMSKSKLNAISPYIPPIKDEQENIIKDEQGLVVKYGADTFRMYEMFLGPVEQSKPWDTKGIEGVHRFLKKLWRLFYDDVKGKIWTDERATDSELKVLHKTIKKIEEDTERFSYNTAVSAFMVCVNELTDLKCHKKEILEPLLILLAPYAPHIAEELYQQIKISPAGRDLEGASVLNASFPKFESKYLVESEKEYPVSINGKMRTLINISLEAGQPEVEKIVLQNEVVQKWTEGKSPKKIIFVKGKMVNVVI